MDRDTVSHFKLRLIWLSALALVGCGGPAPSPPALSDSSAEPRRLQMGDAAQSLLPIEPQRATQATYPFAPKNSTAPTFPVVEQGIPFSPPSNVRVPTASNGPEFGPSQSRTANGALNSAGAPVNLPSVTDGPLPPVDDYGRLPPVDDGSPPAFTTGVPASISAAMAAVDRRAEQLAMQGCSLAERGVCFRLVPSSSRHCDSLPRHRTWSKPPTRMPAHLPPV